MLLYGVVVPHRHVWKQAKALLVKDRKYTFDLGGQIEEKPNEYYRPWGSALGADLAPRKEPTTWDDRRPAREWLAYKVLSLLVPSLP